jgi:signal transduction histidine kinase
MIRVTIRDDGKGMDEATQRRAFDPFYTEPGKHDGRKVGLGLPILKQVAEATGGSVSLVSAPGKGTTLSYSFAAGNVDLPPMGDISDMALGLFNYTGDFELTFAHAKGAESYEISRSELLDAVGSLEDIQGLALAREFLRSQEEALAA